MIAFIISSVILVLKILVGIAALVALFYILAGLFLNCFE